MTTLADLSGRHLGQRVVIDPAGTITAAAHHRAGVVTHVRHALLPDPDDPDADPTATTAVTVADDTGRPAGTWWPSGTECTIEGEQ